eukprot:scaffold30427_cov14-Tisochrysis_lutea.AAC.1
MAVTAEAVMRTMAATSLAACSAKLRIAEVKAEAWAGAGMATVTRAEVPSMCVAMKAAMMAAVV